MKELVQAALEKLRPMLQADGGDIELVDVIEGKVRVKLRGACAGCPGAQMTMKMGVERFLKEKVSGIKEVIAVNF
jgi:Fe-S cluster biogenesis protein NfuA